MWFSDECEAAALPFLSHTVYIYLCECMCCFVSSPFKETGKANNIHTGKHQWNTVQNRNEMSRLLSL